jgi:5S rRNA maturation endonuclease (ribonuclease M5)
MPESNLIDLAFQAKLNTLSQMVMLKFESLVNQLEVNLEPSGSKYIGCCQIHGGDNESAFNIYYDGYSVPGYWTCRTRQCHRFFAKNIIGFTRGILSNREMDWTIDDGSRNRFGFMQTINYLCDFAGVIFNKIKYDYKQADRAAFAREDLAGNAIYVKPGLHRNKVRQHMIFPADYFVARGYSASILDVFDVGMSKKPKSETKDRVIVPIYDSQDRMIGYSARSIFEKCTKCKSFHNPSDLCPELKTRNLYSKWRHVDFESSHHLYNYWKAKPFIKQSNVAVLVEGPGDVWRLEEAGINNGVAMFGVNFSPHQQTLLAQAQCMTIVSLMDTDEAGQNACKKLKKEYGRLFRMYFPRLRSHDIGDMSCDEVTSDIKPLLRSLENI